MSDSNDVTGPEVHEPCGANNVAHKVTPRQAGRKVTAEVTATPPVAGPTGRAVATADDRLTAQRPVPAQY